ncbi:ketosteroid isomerase-like protein [Bradyrhizobium sp. USDA 3315]
MPYPRRTGDLAALRAMLAEDVVVYADGGGRVPAPTEPLVGRDAAMERFAGLARLFAMRPSRLIRYATINGLPGFITIEDDLVQTTALHVENKRVVAVYVTRNPDKLHNVPCDGTAELSAPRASPLSAADSDRPDRGGRLAALTDRALRAKLRRTQREQI